MIQEERHRQASQEGWTSEHDDSHTDKEIAKVSGAYIHNYIFDTNPPGWPKDWVWRDRTPVRTLVIAGALIAAEIDRLLREEAKRQAQLGTQHKTHESRHTDNSGSTTEEQP